MTNVLSSENVTRCMQISVKKSRVTGFYNFELLYFASLKYIKNGSWIVFQITWENLCDYLLMVFMKKYQDGLSILATRASDRPKTLGNSM